MKRYTHAYSSIFSVLLLLLLGMLSSCTDEVETCIDNPLRLSSVYMRSLVEGNFKQVYALSSDSSLPILESWRAVYEKMGSEEKNALRKSTFVFLNEDAGVDKNHYIKMRSTIQQKSLPTNLYIAEDGQCQRVDLSKSFVPFITK